MPVSGSIKMNCDRCIALTLALSVVVACNRPALAYTPTDPIVTKMVDRGIKFLEAKGGTHAGEGAGDSFSRGAGEIVLIGYAHHKVVHDPEHALVKRALGVAKRLVADLEAGQNESAHKRNYTMSMCVLLFADIDARRYQNELTILQQHLFDGQMGHGGFGYPGERDGDVSQVQYVILAIRTLDRNGISLDYAKVVATAQWLLRVQDVNGPWPYHGRDPGVGKPNISQQGSSMSMALAGGSSVLIAGDVLRLWGETVDDTDPGIPGLPEAIKIYKEDTNVRRRNRATMFFNYDL